MLISIPYPPTYMMKITCSSSITLAFMIFFLCPNWLKASDQLKVFTHEINQPFSGSQSPSDAYTAALTKAKFEVLEQAGTYLESLTIVENAILAKDEVIALAGGILQSEVLKVQRYATEQTFGLLLSTRITVNTSILKKRMEKLLNDRSLLKKYNEIQEREKELLAKIEQLEQMNVKAVKSNTLPQARQSNFSKFSIALTASQWVQKALSTWTKGRFADPDKAITYLNKAIALDNMNPRTYNSRAVAHLNLDHEKEALIDLNRALELNPSYADGYNNLGSLYYRQKKYTKAIAAYSKANELQPQFITVILNRGMAYRKIYQFEKAFEDFGRAMALAPQSFDNPSESGFFVELNDITALCKKSRVACKLNLCRSLSFLHERGFCR